MNSVRESQIFVKIFNLIIMLLDLLVEMERRSYETLKLKVNPKS